ncbi:MAG: thioether cross-link-forming SCIFF peptide maturase [Clostridia bacterium]|nr:thioether cross-link-forming SCIFF peptide maturase [Clostridia bacterium]
MVHTFRQNGINVALDVESGAVHLPDDVSFAVLAAFPDKLPTAGEAVAALGAKYGEDELREAVAELKTLADDDMLYTAAEEIPAPVYSSLMPVKAMCLHVAHDCNLRCGYCFASQGDYHGARGIMPPETGKKAIDFIAAVSKGRKNIEIDFFGGEPTMAMKTVKETVAYARCVEKERGKNFRFTITTNGLLLSDENIDFINAEMSNVVLSLDGRRIVNDKMRKCVDGSGSYDIIVPKFKKLLEKRGSDKSYYLRGTFTRDNLDFASDFEHIYGLGFDEISIEPVTAPADRPYALRDEDLPRIAEEYEKLTNVILKLRAEGKKVNFFHFMVDLDGGPCAVKRLKGCGAGNEYVAVAPDGSIYPCHQFVGMDDYKIGSLDEGIVRDDVRRIFAQSSIMSKPDCRDCFAKYNCSGGCAAGNIFYGGGIDSPNKQACFMQKKRLECARVLKAAEAGAPVEF